MDYTNVAMQLRAHKVGINKNKSVFMANLEKNSTVGIVDFVLLDPSIN
jgi:hypothetical protein